ncbi:acyl-CoA dehydrogenase family protein [Pigmentiphaga litoralis]|uniref:acyl-CoA dehydrogenase family protein n=1 Tax=Pigmentiphaga litoralis TaxID=516702 RepID=UPI003B431CA6
MNLTWTDDERRFRDEVRTFVQTHLPTDIRDKSLRQQRLEKDDYLRWHRILDEHGWGAPTWPKEYGGTGWNPLQRLIFEVESFRAGAPRLLPFGLTMLGPVLMKFGSAEQQARLLPRIIRLDDWWCQGYSEPGSGSDLASLTTRAVRDGDHYVVNGQKTWTTLAHYADWIFCLVRTDPDAKPQRGISVLLIDLRSPGVTVRPIRTLDGGHDVNEVWLDNVRVPVGNLVGEENAGWTYAKYLLGHERTGIAGLGHCRRELDAIKALLAGSTDDGEPLAQDPRWRDRVSRLEIDVLALEMLLLRVAAEHDGMPGPETSMLKIRGSEIQQDLAQLRMELAGPDAWPYDPAWLEADTEADVPGPDGAARTSAAYVDMRKTTIYGGTTEVQKNIIARMLLGG